MVAAFAAGMSLLAVLINRALGTGRFDLGNMVQAVWATAHGHLLEVTDVHGRQFSRLGAHFDPFLAVFGALWRLWPSVDMLLVAQAAAVAAGAVPVYLLARRHLRAPWAPLAFAFAYLLYPAAGWLTLNEFHPVAFACPLLLFAFWCLDRDRLLPFALLGLAAATTKEEVGLVVAGFGVWYAFARGRRAAGAAVAAGGALVTLLALYVVIPHFNGAPSSFYDRYTAVGGSPGGIVTGLFTHPLRVPEKLFTLRNLRYLGDLLLPLGLLSLLSPVALVALPEVLLNLLSVTAPQTSVRFHYTAAEIAPLVCAAVLGGARLEARYPGRARYLAPAVAVVAVAASYQIGPVLFWQALPGAGGDVGHAIKTSRHDRIAHAALRLIPAAAPVSATNSLGAQLSARRQIFSFPVLRDARWVAVDEKRLSYQDRFATIPAAVRLVQLRRDPRWRLAFEQDGVLVFRRDPAGSGIVTAAAARRRTPVRRSAGA